MFAHLVFWPWFVGVVFLAGGLAAIRNELVVTPALDRRIVAGRGLAGTCHPWNSSHWKRRPPLVIPTGISCFALLATTTCAALRKESRMQTIRATDLDRKFRGPEFPASRCLRR